ncbi:hypothetical protein ACHMW6_13280 [Pseudoduganella sp. UC29_106]|uniref:hypothetical protein n=1 Tax=Pseudoduganella sp. UC29_106 TaxID=3374553 RepID=UPI0037581022
MNFFPAGLSNLKMPGVAMRDSWHIGAEGRMEHDERVAKLEAVVDQHCEQFKRIEEELVRLREHIDSGLAELREHTDRGLAELREHTDRGLAALREQMEKGFAEQRKTNRWMIGLAVTYGTAILGMLARMSGLA